LKQVQIPCNLRAFAFVVKISQFQNSKNSKNVQSHITHKSFSCKLFLGDGIYCFVAGIFASSLLFTWSDNENTMMNTKMSPSVCCGKKL
jgi:xanthine/uracil permease